MKFAQLLLKQLFCSICFFLCLVPQQNIKREEDMGKIIGVLFLIFLVLLLLCIIGNKFCKFDYRYRRFNRHDKKCLDPDENS